MPTWHLPQVLATLAWLIGDSRSTARLMSWTPWQSLQEGATMRPILSRARPWMLSMYCAAASGYFIWYSCVSPGLLWHLAQVPGRFSLKTGDWGSLWREHVVRAVAIPATGGAGSAHGWLTPWMLVAYCLTGSSWHLTQLGGCAGTLSSGCLEVMSAWQSVQVLVWWTVALNLASSTNRETSLPAALVLVSVLSEWHSRQALLGLLSAAEAGSRPSPQPGPAEPGQCA